MDIEILNSYFNSFLFNLLFYPCFKSICPIQHTAVGNNSSLATMDCLSFSLFCLFTFGNCLVLWKFLSTWAWPVGTETFTRAWFACSFVCIMCLIRMFTVAFKILRAINGEVVVLDTFASWFWTLNLVIRSFMIFIQMIAKALGWRANYFAL